MYTGCGVTMQVEQQCHYILRHLSASVRLGLFYESLCPDSRDFIVNQLQDAYSKLSNITHLELIPYGNAKVCTLQGSRCSNCLLQIAPCRLRGCKNRPVPFSGRMSYKATKPGLVLFYILACFNCVVAY